MKNKIGILITALLFTVVSTNTALSALKNTGGKPGSFNVTSSYGATPLRITKQKPAHKAGEVIVQFKSFVTASAQSRITRNIAAGMSKKAGKYLVVKLRPGQSVSQAVTQFKADSSVQHVQPNYIYRAMVTTTNDPTSSPIYMGRAWDITTDCTSTVVAVLDTGINYNHQDFHDSATGATNIWVNTAEQGGSASTDDDTNGFVDDVHGYDFVDNDGDPMPTGGTENHGTHVAGSIGAMGNNSIGTVGVCPRATIMAVRVLNESGVGTTADVAAGVYYAVDNGAKVINMSMGGTGLNDSILSNAIAYARNNDVVVVASAGNDGINMDAPGAPKTYPCAFPHSNIICVASSGGSISLSSFSNYGSTSVDISIRGENIRSLIAGPIATIPMSTWNLTGWSLRTCPSTTQLVTPFNNIFCGVSFPSAHASNVNYVAYKTLDMATLFGGATVTAMSMEFTFLLHLEQNVSYFDFKAESGTADPFTGSSPIASITGHARSDTAIGGTVVTTASQCVGQTNCSIGFRLRAGPPNLTTSFYGINVYNLVVGGLDPNSNSYQAFSGTSMAAANMSGLVAFIRTINNYNADETIRAVTYRRPNHHWPALQGMTRSERPADDPMNAMQIMTVPGTPTAALVP